MGLVKYRLISHVIMHESTFLAGSYFQIALLSDFVSSKF